MTPTTTHWFRLLEDSGVSYLVDEAERKLRLVAALEDELRCNREEFIALDAQIERRFAGTAPDDGWTPAEISAARDAWRAPQWFAGGKP